MLAKIFAAMNGAFALFLLFCSINGTRNVEVYFDAGALASAVLAIGCWKRKRWIVAVGAVPIILVGVACAILVDRLQGFLTPKEAGMVNLLVFAAIAVAIGSMVVAGKPPEAEPSSTST